MADNIIDIIISAKWIGSAATGQAAANLRALGNSAAMSSTEMAAIAARSQLLSGKLSELVTAVGSGQKSLALATLEFETFKNGLFNVVPVAQQAGEATQQAGQAAEQAGKTAESASAGFAALAGKLFVVIAIIGLTQRAWQALSNTIKSGVEIDLITRRFDRLATTIGTTGDALRRDLGPAMQGLVSDVDAMAYATDFLSLGLVADHDQAVRLARVAAQLDFNMNHLVLTMTNFTTLRFDQLGIRVDGFREKVQALEAAGYEADAAFREAFIQQAEQQLEIVGSRAEYTAGKIDILAASWENFTNRATTGITNLALPTLDFLLGATYAADEASAALVKYSEALDTGNIGKQKLAVDELNDALIKSRALQFRGGLFPGQVEAQNQQTFNELIVKSVQGLTTYEDQIEKLRKLGFFISEGTVVEFGTYVANWDRFLVLLEQARIRQINEDFKDQDEKLGFLIDDTAKVTEEYFKLAKELGITRQEAQSLITKLGDVHEAFKVLQDIEDPEAFFEGLNKSIKDVQFEALLKQVGLTKDEFYRLSLTVGGTDNAVALLDGTFAKLQERLQGGAFQAQFGITPETQSAIEGSGANLLGRITPGAAFGARFQAIPEDLINLADLFSDFQSDLSDIVDRESEQREQIEEATEKQRNDIVDDYGKRRARAERDFQRQREKEDRKLERDIQKAREKVVDKQKELQEDANRDLEKLEHDHLKRIEDIIAQADFDLQEAASRLDARAVASIIRQRDKALRDEQDKYREQRKEIQKELKIRLEEEKKSAEERIAELKEFHDERQKEEKEDFDYRMQILQDEQDERLRELEDQKNERLREIHDQAIDEAKAREDDYVDQRRKLTDHWVKRNTLEQIQRDNLLAAEANWWQKRIGLIPDEGGNGGGGTTTGGGGGGGTTTTPPPPGGSKPSRFWLEQTVISIAKPTNNEQAFAWYQWMSGKSDAELAHWIEAHSDIDVPGYARGTPFASGGLALVGEEGPELVNLPGGSQVFDSRTTQRMMGNVSIDSIEINILEATRPGDTAREVRREMTKLFEELVEPA